MNTQPLKLTPITQLQHAAQCLKILGHPHRLRIIQILLQHRCTVAELASACKISSPMTSDHLKLMQRCGFLASTREGQRVYYHVAEPHLKNILLCVEQKFGVASESL